MRLATILCLTGCAAGISVPSGYGQTYMCLLATDSLAINLRDYVVQLVTATDSASVVHRIRYRLPITTANKVSVQTAESTCSTAGAKYHAATSVPGSPAISRTLVVIRIGTTRFVVRDTEWAMGGGGYSPTVVFDKNWNKLAGWEP